MVAHCKNNTERKGTLSIDAIYDARDSISRVNIKPFPGEDESREMTYFSMLPLSFPQAFAAWLRLASGVSAQDLANQPLTKAALDGLNEQTTFDAAVDAVCELIRYTVSGSGLGDIVAHMPLVQVREKSCNLGRWRENFWSCGRKSG